MGKENFFFIKKRNYCELKKFSPSWCITNCFLCGPDNKVNVLYIIRIALRKREDRAKKARTAENHLKKFKTTLTFLMLMLTPANFNLNNFSAELRTLM